MKRILKASLPLGAFFCVYVAFVFFLGDQSTAHSDEKPYAEHTFLGCDRFSDPSLSNSFGPIDGVTGAPGESTCAMSLCHNSFILNEGDGSLTIIAPSQFFPSDTIDIDIKLEDPGQSRWGFEITALDSGNNPAGDLIVVNSSRTQKSTGGAFFRQYIKHTTIGTDNGFADSGLGWSVRWVSLVVPLFLWCAGFHRLRMSDL